jgi:Lsr2
MAQKVTTVVEMTDDLDGGKAEQTVRFAFDGHHYEIDLSKKNANALSKALKPYVDSARKVRASRARAATTRRSTQQVNLTDVRAWARSSGYDISDRGRIPAAVMAAYQAK